MAFITDTYAWMAYFKKSSNYKEIIEEGELIIPATVLAEVTRVFLRNNKNPDSALKFMLTRGVVKDLDKNQGIKAGQLAEEKKLDMLDALAYACSDENNLFLTGDQAFEKIEHVKYIKQ